MNVHALFEDEPQEGVDEVTQAHLRGDADGVVTAADLNVTIDLDRKDVDYQIPENTQVLREFQKRGRDAADGGAPAARVLPHEKVYSAFAPRRELDKHCVDIDAALQCDAQVDFARLTNDERRRMFFATRNMLSNVLCALGLQPTSPDYPDSYDFSYGTLKLLLGHFETSTLRLSNLKERREYVPPGSQVPIWICKSRVWNLWRRGVGDDVFDELFVWNVVPWSAHARADSKALKDNKGKPLITSELLAEPAYYRVEKLVVRMMRIIGARVVVTMGEQARKFVRRNRVAFSSLVHHFASDVFTDPTHACWILDRALLRAVHDGEDMYVAKQHHFFAYGVAFGKLTGDEALGSKRAQELLDRIRRKWQVEIDGEWRLLTPEEQTERSKQRRADSLRQPRPGAPCAWTRREYGTLYQRAVRDLPRSGAPCAWTVREYGTLYKRAVKDLPRPGAPCAWTVREYGTLYKRVTNLDRRRFRGAGDHAGIDPTREPLAWFDVQQLRVMCRERGIPVTHRGRPKTRPVLVRELQARTLEEFLAFFRR